MRQRNTHFPYLTQGKLHLKPIAPSELPRTTWQPTKDAAFRIMLERIDASKTYLNGKK